MDRDTAPLTTHHCTSALPAAGLVTVLTNALALESRSFGEAAAKVVDADVAKEARAAGAAGSELSSRLN